MAFILSVAFITFQTPLAQALVSCTTGECAINCEEHNCDIVICTNYASSCIINCSDDTCKDSQFYLAARNYNTVYCTGHTACNEINIQCGSPDQPPIGYSEYDFIGRYDSALKCNFVSKPEPFIAPAPTLKPTIKPTPKLHKPLALNPITPSPTDSPTVSTNIQNEQLNNSENDIKNGIKNNGSLVGTEILIVLSSVGLFCVIFTICFCICMSVDYHQKLTLIRKQHEKHVAENMNNNVSPLPHQSIINMAIADAKSQSIVTTISKLSTACDMNKSVNVTCMNSEQNSSSNATSTKLSMENNSNAASSKLSVYNYSNAASSKLSVCSNSNTESSNCKLSVSKSAENSATTDVPSFSVSPIDSEKSGDIVTVPVIESEMKLNNGDHKQNESEANLDTKLSVSVTGPVIINDVVSHKHMRNDTFGTGDESGNMNDTNTVIRKDTIDSNVTNVSVNTIEQSIPSVPSSDYRNDSSGDQQTGKIYDFNCILNENDCDDEHSVYYD